MYLFLAPILAIMSYGKASRTKRECKKFRKVVRCEAEKADNSEPRQKVIIDALRLPKIVEEPEVEELKELSPIWDDIAELNGNAEWRENIHFTFQPGMRRELYTTALDVCDLSSEPDDTSDTSSLSSDNWDFDPITPLSRSLMSCGSASSSLSSSSVSSSLSSLLSSGEANDNHSKAVTLMNEIDTILTLDIDVVVGHCPLDEGSIDEILSLACGPDSEDGEVITPRSERSRLRGFFTRWCCI